MTTIQIMTAPVAGQRLHSKGADNWKLLLFRVDHVLSFQSTNVETVELASGRSRLLIRAVRASAIVSDTHFDFSSKTGNGVKTWQQSCVLDGAVIISRTKDNEHYKIEIGMLRAHCPALDSQEHLTSLWPVAVTKTAWDYLWTPYGLGVESLLRLDGDMRHRALLLPVLDNADDIAWMRQQKSDLSVEKLYPSRQGQQEQFNALEAASLNFGRYTPDNTVWPLKTAVGSTARRWRVLQMDVVDGLIDHVLRPLGASKSFISLESVHRVSRSPFLHPEFRTVADGPVGDIAIVADLWAAHEYWGKQKVIHRGIVIVPLKVDIRASMRWNSRGTGTALVPEKIHIACVYDTSTGELKRTHQTLEVGSTTTRPEDRPLVIQFSPAPSLTIIKPVNFSLVGVSPSTGEPENEALRNPLPRWLALQDGWLDLDVSLYTNNDRPRTLLNEILADQGGLAGGVPLGEIGGPDGLTAMLPDANSVLSLKPYVRLRIDAGGATLGIEDAALLWETPAWWVLDDVRLVKDEQEPHQEQPFASPLVLPDLPSAFEAQFGAMNDVGSEGEKRLLAAVASCFRGTIWVGHRALAVENGWRLSTESGKTQLVIPRLSSSSLFWIRTPDATVLSTLPHAGYGDSSILLDGTRSLTPLRHEKAENIALRLDHGCLPVLTTAIIKSIEKPPTAPWVHTGAEQFFPLAPGVGYQPNNQTFQYRHAPQMATHGYLSQTISGHIEYNNASLSSARASDDVAIQGSDGDLFKLVGGHLPVGKSLRLKGWVPLKELYVTKFHLRYQPLDEKPSLNMTVLIGKNDDISAGVNIGAAGSSFDTALDLKTSADFKQFWLEPAPVLKPGNFVGFGQPLLSQSSLCEFADGTGQHWTLFDGGARDVVNGALNQERLSFTAHSRLFCSPESEGSAVSVALLDVLAGTAEKTAIWDLLGEINETGVVDAPEVGPYPLIARSLVSTDRKKVVTSLIVGQPFSKDNQGGADNLGEVNLVWTGHPGGSWSISSHSDGHFDWYVRSETWLELLPSEENGPFVHSNIKIHRLEGTVSITDGLVELCVTAATVSTVLGLLRFKTQITPLIVEMIDEGEEVVNLHLKTIPDPVGGFEVNMYLCCERASNGGATWYLKANTASAIVWKQSGQKPLTLTLLPNEMMATICHLQSHHAAASIPDFKVGFSQSSPRCFAFVYSQDANDQIRASALAGSILVVQEEMPRLEWSLRESTILDASLLFGATESHEVRGDIHVQIVRNTPSILQGSSITGWVKLQNDVQFDVGADRYIHRVQLIFDGIPLQSRGELHDSFDAIAQHAFAVSDGAEQPIFQGIHRFSVLKQPGHLPYLQCTALLLLTEVPSDVDTPWAMQIQIAGDTSVFMAQTQQPNGVISGRLIRLALRNSGKSLTVSVPTSTMQPPLPGLPSEPMDLSKIEDVPVTDIWHERGALAGFLSPAGLALVAKHQTAVSFASSAFPTSGTELSEWYHCLTNKQQLFMAATVSAAQGVLLMPFSVRVEQKGKVFALATQDALNPALRVELLSVEARGTAGPLTHMASGLVHLSRNDSALQLWARQELRRQSS